MLLNVKLPLLPGTRESTQDRATGLALQAVLELQGNRLLFLDDILIKDVVTWN